VDATGGTAFADELVAAAAAADAWPCISCGRSIAPLKMREHMGTHILKGHIPDVINACGCCGGLGCTATLQVRNKKEQPEVDCK
jgi:hypothetical protein